MNNDMQLNIKIRVGKRYDWTTSGESEIEVSDLSISEITPALAKSMSSTVPALIISALNRHSERVREELKTKIAEAEKEESDD